jgi:hypothetical protein
VLRSIGLPELLVLVFVAAILVVPFWRIFSKAGYPGVLSIAMLIPLLNIGMWFFLGFSEWPVLKELKALRQRAAMSGPPPLS